MTPSSTPLTPREEAIELFNLSATERAAEFTSLLDGIVSKLMTRHGVKSYYMSRKDMDEAMMACGKDIEKMAIFQHDNIEVMKLVGYMCFWIRKIKPFHSAVTPAGEKITDINERFSLWLLELLGCMQMRRGDPANKKVYSNADIADVRSRFDQFFKDEKYFNYVIHSMRARTFGPHHFVIFLMKMVNGY